MCPDEFENRITKLRDQYPDRRVRLERAKEGLAEIRRRQAELNVRKRRIAEAVAKPTVVTRVEVKGRKFR